MTKEEIKSKLENDYEFFECEVNGMEKVEPFYYAIFTPKDGDGKANAKLRIDKKKKVDKGILMEEVVNDVSELLQKGELIISDIGFSGRDVQI